MMAGFTRLDCKTVLKATLFLLHFYLTAIVMAAVWRARKFARCVVRFSDRDL